MVHTTDDTEDTVSHFPFLLSTRQMDSLAVVDRVVSFKSEDEMDVLTFVPWWSN